MLTRHGSCHCGAVRFEAEIDFAAGTLRCNCSICAKARFWAALVKPEAFRLLAGAGELSEFESRSGPDRHFFCKHCGIRPFGTGKSPRLGEFYGVNVACLDDVADEELAAIPVTYVDGRDDNWHAAPVHTRHL